ncbi:hypothetical protein NFI96_019074 [Prochilodus magdalenae]|nr:hypothetical protein NFI96_019074 [Prochilodus magdalenae]
MGSVFTRVTADYVHSVVRKDGKTGETVLAVGYIPTDPVDVILENQVPKYAHLNPLASQAAVAAAAAMGSIAGSQVFGNALPSLQGVTGQLVTNAQGQCDTWAIPCWSLLATIIGTIPLMPNSAGPSNQSGGGTPSLQVQPITPQLLTNAQGQIIATVIGNQILPVINTQGITLSPIKPGQQVVSTQAADVASYIN